VVLFVVCSVACLAGAKEPPAKIACLGLHGGVNEPLQRYAKELGLRVDYVTDDQIADRKTDLGGYAVVLLEHLRNEDREALRELFTRAKAANPALHIFSVSGSAVGFLKDQGKANPIEHDAELQKYYGSGQENLRRLLVYLAAKYLGQPGTIEPPVETPTGGLYHPDRQGLFSSVDEFLQWAQTRGWDTAQAPRAVVTVHQTHLEFQQPKVVDALIRQFEKQRIMAVAVVDLNPQYEQLLLKLAPDVVVHTCHSGDGVALRRQLDVPHLHSIFFNKDSIDEWYASPQGLGTSDIIFQVATQELLGPIEPQIGGGTQRGHGSGEAITPIPDRIEHLVGRAAAWVKLRHTPEAEKRVAIVYYDRELGKSELMRGSTTGMFLHAPKSLVALLRKMKLAGYGLAPLPANEDELIHWMMDRGRQIGVWAPGVLDHLARSGDAVLVPAETYLEWFHSRVPKSCQEEVIKHWGPPPGQFLVWENAGRRYIVIPRIDLGNVILLPQPLRGEAHDPSLLHDRRVPPPHNYLATYFWLQSGFQAHALVHFGTHGSEFALPGKQVGLSNQDWPDIVMGAMPNINPWVIDNLGESSPAKRRAYAVLISYLTPPLVNAGLSDELLNLHDTIDKWDTLEQGALREKFRKQITSQVAQCGVDHDLHLSLTKEQTLSDAQITRVAEYLHQIHNEATPTSLHVLGEPPREDLLIPSLVTILRLRFLNALAEVCPVPPDEATLPGDREKYLRKVAEAALDLVIHKHLAPAEAVAAVGGKTHGPLPENVEKGFQLALDLQARFARTGDEIDNLLAALRGRFVPPGPGNSPERNPDSVPTGRNLYLVNPQEIPSQPSWEIGKSLVDQYLKRTLKEKGSYPQKVGFDLSSFATFRDYGVMESQILYCLGVEPVWDDHNQVLDVKLIPREKLARPRVDVFIAAGTYYLLNLPTRMELLDKAVRLVAALDEPDNYVHRDMAHDLAELQQKGIEPKRAALLASARVFGYPPGVMGNAGYYYLVERSGSWNSREELIQRYLTNVQYVYTKGLWGEEATEAYQTAIQGTQTVMRSWSDHLTSPLSNKYAWYHGGSLCLAVKQLTGKEPEFLLSDVRDPDRTEMVAAEDALHREFHVSLLNRKWIEGMMKEGYAGADQVAVMVSNSMGWQIMREGSVGDETWNEIAAVYVHDKLGLSVQQWMETSNPYAYQDMTEVMLETIRKGYWKADPALKREIAEQYAQSVVRHGEGGGVRGGGNTGLERFVAQTLKDAGRADLVQLAAAYQKRLQESVVAAAGSAPGTAPAPGAVAAAPPQAVPVGMATNAAAAPSPATPPAAQAPDRKPRDASASHLPANQPQNVNGFRVAADRALDSVTKRQWMLLGALAVAALVVAGMWRRAGVPK
jgi:cobaltochelatase CobN